MTVRGFAIFVLAGAITTLLPAAEPEAAPRSDARLRELLRTTTQELRTAQDDLAALQATMATKERERTVLVTQLSALTRRSATERDETAKLQSKLAAKDEEIARLNSELEKWKTMLGRENDLAQTAEAERARLAQQISALERTVADREAKNVALVKIANEILARYEKERAMGLEPFLGLKRVELEALVQGYSDKILDQKYSKTSSVPSAPSK